MTDLRGTEGGLRDRRERAITLRNDPCTVKMSLVTHLRFVIVNGSLLGLTEHLDFEVSVATQAILFARDRCQAFMVLNQRALEVICMSMVLIGEAVLRCRGKVQFLTTL